VPRVPDSHVKEPRDCRLAGRRLLGHFVYIDRDAEVCVLRPILEDLACQVDRHRLKLGHPKLVLLLAKARGISSGKLQQRPCGLQPGRSGRILPLDLAEVDATGQRRVLTEVEELRKPPSKCVQHRLLERPLSEESAYGRLDRIEFLGSLLREVNRLPRNFDRFR